MVLKTAGASSHVFAAPVSPSMEEPWRRFLQEVAESPMEYERFRRRLGLRRELVWLVPSVRGVATVAYLEVDGGFDEAVRRLSASEEPFDVWVREEIAACHGRERVGPTVSSPASTLDPAFSWDGASGDEDGFIRTHTLHRDGG